MLLSETEVQILMERVILDFDGRHRKLRAFLLSRYMGVRSHLGKCDGSLTENRKLLIGSYFTQEYALESAALFNPSIVWHPDQSGVGEGSRRFVLSLRATGEGHISSICFRSGTINSANEILFDPLTKYVAVGVVVPDVYYERNLFSRKLWEIGISSSFVDEVLGSMGDKFTMNQLEDRLDAISSHHKSANDRTRAFQRNREHITSLAQSNYEVTFTSDQLMSERVLFPTTPVERNGIEDARFVRFEEEGIVRYFATYTAYNGSVTVPQIIETEDFLGFQVNTLNGPEVQNKGMALFPRKINGLFAMISRQDNENIYLMFSEHPHFWHTKELLISPEESWEFVQLGNCGSPIETDKGWLLLSHGVGPMRRYCISAFLLDLENPRKVIGRLKEPLLMAEGDEREGYVPNVVYSCGSFINGDSLIMPYAVSDYATSFAVVDLRELLEKLVE